MRVMLDVFSGRPNPTWDVPRPLARHVLQLVSRQGGPAAAAVPPHVLGYRGLLVQPMPGDDATVWPASFRLGVPGGLPAARTMSAAERTVSPPDEERKATLALLESAGPWVERDVIDEAARSVEGGAERAAVEMKAVSAEAAPALPDMDPPCEPLLSAYRPWFWNVPAVRLRNNCYNYASNCVSNAVAQPGRRVGRQYDAFTCEAVARAAMADGYRADCEGEARMVALAVWPGRDFHWYRRHDGFWAHKLGIYSARNVDNRGRVIGGALTPAICDRAPYTQFCAYLFVPPAVEVL